MLRAGQLVLSLFDKKYAPNAHQDSKTGEPGENRVRR